MALASITGTVRYNRKGDKGDPVTVVSVQYQSGSSSTSVPTGTWSTSVVSVPAGYYLWTKTTFSDGTVSYSVAKQGENGKAGAGYYMAGSYSDTTSYVRDSYKAPVVELGSIYYALLKEGTTKGVNPKTDVANNGGTWGMVGDLKYIMAELAFIKFGKLGSAVFNGDFMFSQYGVDSNGASTSAYESFDASLSDPTANAAFMPNILLNFFNGKAWFRGADVKGTVTLDALYRRTAEGGTSESMTDLSKYSGFAMNGVYRAPQVSGKYFTELVGLNLSPSSRSLVTGEIHFPDIVECVICNGTLSTAVTSLSWGHSGGFIRMTMFGFRYADYGVCWVVEAQGDDNFTLTVNSEND